MSFSEICPILLMSMSVSTTKGLPERNNHYKDYRLKFLYKTKYRPKELITVYDLKIFKHKNKMKIPFTNFFKLNACSIT